MIIPGITTAKIDLFRCNPVANDKPQATGIACRLPTSLYAGRSTPSADGLHVQWMEAFDIDAGIPVDDTFRQGKPVRVSPDTQVYDEIKERGNQMGRMRGITAERGDTGISAITASVMVGTVGALRVTTRLQVIVHAECQVIVVMMREDRRHQHDQTY
ncbi:unknown [Bacteroides sp. CAG:462]|nr:unknown [Bacteroides sp. CAG:462]